MPFAADTSAADGGHPPLPALRARLQEAASAPALAARLRQALPGLRVSVMEAFDLRHEPPWLRAGRFALHLAAQDGHCWRLTTRPAEATALMITEDREPVTHSATPARARWNPSLAMSPWTRRSP